MLYLHGDGNNTRLIESVSSVCFYTNGKMDEDNSYKEVRKSSELAEFFQIDIFQDLDVFLANCNAWLDCCIANNLTIDEPDNWIEDWVMEDQTSPQWLEFVARLNAAIAAQVIPF